MNEHAKLDCYFRVSRPDGICAILRNTYSCYGCKFYKTEAQREQGIQRAKEILKAKGLKRVEIDGRICARPRKDTLDEEN